jgi:hypothetical protein
MSDETQTITSVVSCLEFRGGAVLSCHTPVVLIGFVRSLSFALFVPFLSSFLSPSGGYTSTKYHPFRSNFLFLSSSFFLRRHSDALFFYLVVIVTSQSLRI